MATLALCGAVATAQAETVRIATEGAYPPFNYVDSNNQLHGFDVDIANALCAKMKVECELVAQDWDGIIPALLAKKYDAVVASMVITEERQKKVAFTDRYYRTKLAVAVAKGATVQDTRPESFKGLVVGAQSSTTQGMYAEDVFGAAGAEVKLYPSQDEANADLNNGRLDALVHDKFPLLDWLAKDGKDCCKLLGDIQETDDDVAIAVRQDDNALRERLNKALAEIIADGTYKQIASRYFPFDIY
ncbi:ABC transporter substrate-binding protein [Pseudomonas sp. DB1]|uniref:ABC transporter substrate-binding protein n=2 Tax=Metapseudomonas boanensis TaxID=2822138 RepID=A0ABS5XJH3_9GAMM|nr:ABC transporter substrate-binding protein [Pseudomonas boanensis]MBT8767838.1 ABC transporter substrate-binding protein [Pseudomonas boanensis]